MLDTEHGRVIGLVTSAESVVGTDPASRAELIGGRTVNLSTSPSNGKSVSVANWVEGEFNVTLWGTAPDVTVAKIVSLTSLDAEGYLVPTPESASVLAYRGDVKPWFATAQSPSFLTHPVR